MLALVFVAAAIARLVSAWYVGHDLTLGELVRGTPPSAARAARRLACSSTSSRGAPSSASACSWLAVMTWFLVTAPVIGAEPAGPHPRHAPSAGSVNRRFWNVLGAALLAPRRACCSTTPSRCVPCVVAPSLGTEGRVGAGPPRSASSPLITCRSWPPVTVLIYLDLRVRTEGLDLELGAEGVPPAT